MGGAGGAGGAGGENANVTLMDADDKVRGVCCVESIPRVSVHETSADEEAVPLERSAEEFR